MFRCIPCLVLILANVGAEEPRSREYPKSGLLIEAAELAKPQVAKRFRILDARPPEKYKAGHVPLASRVDVPRWHKNFSAGPDKKVWQDRLKNLGIGGETPVVVYGDDLRETARIWWILRYWGVHDARILNGGWQAWKAADGKVDKGVHEGASFAPAVGAITAQPGRLAVKSDVFESLKNNRFQLADARSDKEYCGTATTARRNGSIPTARHLEWSDLVETKTQRFKTAPELAKLFKDAKIDLERPTMTYCQSGGRAAVMAFALELMGAKDVRNYYRSWAEWGNDEKTPIEKKK
jgi:thiosulfate/3-mercaptopyruvate sulfurtransferase